MKVTRLQLQLAVVTGISMFGVLFIVLFMASSTSDGSFFGGGTGFAPDHTFFSEFGFLVPPYKCDKVEEWGVIDFNWKYRVKPGHICEDTTLTAKLPASGGKENDCIVYSFLNSDWRSFNFDKYAASKGCKVVSFSSQLGKPEGVGGSPVGDHTFYHGTLGQKSKETEKDALYLKPIRTIGSWMEKLGHTNVDVLRLDLEGGEFELMQDLINKQKFYPRQINLLINFYPTDTQQELERKGNVLKKFVAESDYRLFYRQMPAISLMHPVKRDNKGAIVCCYELSFIYAPNTNRFYNQQ